MLCRALVSACAVLLVLCAGCAQPQTDVAAPVSAATGDVATDNSVRVFIDSVTGQIREPIEVERKDAAHRASASASREGGAQFATETVLPDGTVEVDISTLPRHEVKACLDSRGVPSFDCPEGEAP